LNITYFFHGILIGIMSSAPLGPIAVLCIQRTINKGMKAGLILSSGAVIGDFLYAIVIGFGLTMISDVIFAYQNPIRLIGGIFVVYIGAKIFYSNPAKLAEKQNNTQTKLFQDFMTSFFITISNPLTLIGFGGLFAVFGSVDQQATTLNMSFTVLGVITGACIWWIILVSIVNLFKNKITNQKLLWINKITGFCVSAIGLLLAVSVFFSK